MKFERAVKSRPKSNLALNPYRASARVLPVRTFRVRDAFEEIDIALEIGEKLFVIEVKYDHIPTEPYEIFNFFRGANDACVQASRKVKVISDNLQHFQSMQIVGARVKSAVGLVLNSTMLLSGLTIDDVSIIDEKMLDGYIRNYEEGSVLIGRTAFFGAMGKDLYYRSREEFERGAAVYFQRPPELARFEALLSRVKFARSGGPVPKTKGYDLAIYDRSPPS